MRNETRSQYNLRNDSESSSGTICCDKDTALFRFFFPLISCEADYS